MDHASIDGYSFIKDAIPYIVITGRYNRIDNLAFTVMHELGHIYMNHTTEESQQINIDTRSFEEEDENQKEIEADKFASNWLISESLWKLAPGVNVLNPYLIQVKYSEWATKRNLNKWIVLGRLSHETGIYKFKSDNTRCVNTQEGGNM
jgi:HTH-type transcriptional regulator/antitoxin HigA